MKDLERIGDNDDDDGGDDNGDGDNGKEFYGLGKDR